MSETQREISAFRRKSSLRAAPVLVSMVAAWLGVACASKGAGTSESPDSAGPVSGGNGSPATAMSSGGNAPADRAGSARDASASAGSTSNTARGSAMECAAVLDVVRTLGSLQESRHRQALELLARVVAMLTKLCRVAVAVAVAVKDHVKDHVNDNATTTPTSTPTDPYGSF